jgi:hypothetical protein
MAAVVLRDIIRLGAYLSPRATATSFHEVSEMTAASLFRRATAFYLMILEDPLAGRIIPMNGDAICA